MDRRLHQQPDAIISSAAAEADNGNSVAVVDGTRSHPDPAVVVFERLPESGLAAAWYDLAVPLILLTLLLVVLFAGSAAILVWLCHRPRRRSKDLSLSAGRGAKDNTRRAPKDQLLLIRQNSTIDLIDETPSLSPTLRISPSAIVLPSSPAPGLLPPVVVSKPHTMHRSRITQTDLSTPPLRSQPPPLPLPKSPEPSPAERISPLLLLPATTTSSTTSSFRRFTFNTSEVLLTPSSSSSPPPTTEWILHDAATIQPSLAQADICCIQPTIPQSIPKSHSQSGNAAFRYGHYYRAADVTMAFNVNDDDGDDGDLEDVDDDVEEKQELATSDLHDDMQRLQLLPAIPPTEAKSEEAACSSSSLLLVNRRRARLKSISLDSDGARLVEENLGAATPLEVSNQQQQQEDPSESIQNQDLNSESSANMEGGRDGGEVDERDGGAGGAVLDLCSITNTSSSSSASSSSEPTTPKKRRRRLGCQLGTTTTQRTNPSPSLSSLNHMHSASTNNLKTLPEVMTLTDFEPSAAFVFPNTATAKPTSSSSACSRSTTSILHRRGSNQSLTLALDQQQQQQHSHTSSSHQQPPHHLQTNQQQPRLSASNYNLNSSTTAATRKQHKQNLLQRRGSNTSLTLNIQHQHPINSSSANSLNRFNSHSSLNYLHHHNHNHPAGGAPRKGLLERRNSNASLTLTIQSRAASLSVSNCNLMLCASSECSLASNPAQLLAQEEAEAGEEEEEQHPCPLHGSSEVSAAAMATTSTTNSCGHRRYLSSENLNLQKTQHDHHHHHHPHHPQHHHSSASDLKTTSSSSTTTTPLLHGNQDDHEATSSSLHHLQCTCPPTTLLRRNITTKPLSPQTTSEDFKIYLANIQMLQNASNVLTPGQLGDLGQIFERSYQKKIEEIQQTQQIQLPEVVQQEIATIPGVKIRRLVIDSDDTTIILDDHHHHPSSESASYTSTSSSDDEPPPLPSTPPVLVPSPSLRPPPPPPSHPASPFIGALSPAPPPATNTSTAEDDDRQKTLLRQLHQEFWDLPTNYQEKPLVFGSQAKNRYKTILPNEHSRVLLLDDEENEDEEEEDEQEQEAGRRHRSPHHHFPSSAQPSSHRAEPYINANYIKGPDYTQNSYIATQGPLPNTIYEFWLMVQQNVRRAGPSTGRRRHRHHQKIAMLTDLTENGRQKCAAYFPVQLEDRLVVMDTTRSTRNNQDQQQQHKLNVDAEDRRPSTQLAQFEGNCFVVQNQAIYHKNGYTIRRLRVRRYSAAGTVRTEFYVHHYWFPGWPDHRSPCDIDVLLDLSLDLLDGRPDVEADDNQDQDDDHDDDPLDDPITTGPLPIIHCSAGIGRTGCLAAILNGLRQMRCSNTAAAAPTTSITTASSATVDVLGIVCNLRLQRGGMVQNSEQYELIHRALCLYQRRTAALVERALDDAATAEEKVVEEE